MKLSRLSVFFAIVFVVLSPSLLFLPQHISSLISYTTNANTSSAGDPIDSLIGFFLPFGIYGLGNLPPYVSDLSLPKELIYLAISALALILVYGICQLLSATKSPQKNSEFGFQIRIFIFINLFIQFFFAFFYARNQSYTYSKAGYYLLPIFLLAIALVVISFHNFLIAPILIFLIPLLLATSLSLSLLIVKGEERSAIGSLKLASTLKSIHKDSQVVYFPLQNPTTSAYIAVRETYLWHVKSIFIHGTNSQPGFQFKMSSDEIYVVEDLEDKTTVRSYSCELHPCGSTKVQTGKTDMPNLLLDFDNRVIFLVSKDSN